MAKEPKGPMDESIDKRGKEKEPDKDGGRGINRRVFLGAMATMGGAVVLARPAKSHASADFEGYPNSFGLLTDLTACVGCRSCEKACNAENKLPAPAKPFDDNSVFEEKRMPTQKAYTIVNKYENPKDKDKPIYRKIQCNHCK